MKILAFTYFANVWLHAFPESLCLEALEQKGHTIIRVGCDGQMSEHCVAMAALSISIQADPATKQAVCKSCRMRRGIIEKEFACKHELLDSYVTAEDVVAIDALLESTPLDQLIYLEWQGLPVGRCGAYDYFLRFKRLQISEEPEQVRYLKNAIRNVMYAASGSRQLIERHKPDAIWSHNNLYGVNYVAHKLAKELGLVSFTHNTSPNFSERLQSNYVGLDTIYDNFDRLKEEWPEYSKKRIPPDVSRRVSLHYKKLLSGNLPFVYSSKYKDNASPREHFGVPPGAKLLLATLSSYDETKAAEFNGSFRDYHYTFPMQTDWLRQLVKWMKDRPDYFLVVRVHPREYPNTRDTYISEHALELRDCLTDLPPNVAINLPTDNFSMYQFLNETDVMLNAWSTAGREFALYGIPVVTYTDACGFPMELSYFGTTPEEYFANIPRAIADGWSPDRIVTAFRWHAVEFFYRTVDVSESCHLTDITPDQIFNRVVLGVMRRLAPGSLERRDCRRRVASPSFAGILDEVVRSGLESPVKAQVARQPQVTEAEELAGIKSAVRTLYEMLYHGSGPAQKDTLQSRLAGWLQ